MNTPGKGLISTGALHLRLADAAAVGVDLRLTVMSLHYQGEARKAHWVVMWRFYVRIE
jgi:hypothetical protein